MLSMSGTTGSNPIGVENTIEELDNQFDCEFAFHSAVESDYAVPKTWKQILKHPPEEVKKWMERITKEFADFERRQIWKVIKIKVIPKGRKLIGSKWVFKLKRDGKYVLD
jgi:hypothetical protein